MRTQLSLEACQCNAQEGTATKGGIHSISKGQILKKKMRCNWKMGNCKEGPLMTKKGGRGTLKCELWFKNKKYNGGTGTRRRKVPQHWRQFRSQEGEEPQKGVKRSKKQKSGNALPLDRTKSDCRGKSERWERVKKKRAG